MKITNTQLAVLHALLRLANRDASVSVEMLATLVRAPGAKVRSALLKLEGLGWVDAARCRLTFDGLAIAHASRGLATPSDQAQRSTVHSNRAA